MADLFASSVKPSAEEMVNAQLVQAKLEGKMNVPNRGLEKALETQRNFLFAQATKQIEKEGKVEPTLLRELFEADVKLEEFREKKYSGVSGLFLKIGEKSLPLFKKAGELGIKGGKGIVKAGAELEEKQKKERALHPEAPTGVERFTGSSVTPWRRSALPMVSRKTNAVHSTLPYSSNRNALWNLR